jgi:hypothetical protein
MTHSRLIAIASVLALLAPPRHAYRFTVEYFTFDAKGAFLQKQRVAGDYSAGEPGDNVGWSHVTLATATSLSGGYATAEPQQYMEGFSYSPARERVFAPDFFKGFPATATHAKNLVWDTFMLETFAQELPKVKAASPYHMPSGSVPLAGAGVFKNTDIQLTWLGLVERNKQECALVQYEAFFNTVTFETPGVTLIGRSDYWGDIWVTLATGDIEYATLAEEVAGELRLAAQPAPQNVNIVRKGTFERIRN